MHSEDNGDNAVSDIGRYLSCLQYYHIADMIISAYYHIADMIISAYNHIADMIISAYYHIADMIISAYYHIGRNNIADNDHHLLNLY